VAVVANDMAGAERALRRAIALDPAGLEAYSLLGRLLVSQRRTKYAKEEFIALAAKQSRPSSSLTMVGLLCQAEGDTACAMEWYEKAFRADPRAAAAANNLAWIYTSQGKNLDAALQMAEAARGSLPNQPEVNDTLGWVYYNKGLQVLAIRALKQAVELDPANPVHTYHLGMAYAKNGDDRSARTALEKALKLKSDFKGADEARQTLQTLLY